MQEKKVETERWGLVIFTQFLTLYQFYCVYSYKLIYAQEKCCVSCGPSLSGVATTKCISKIAMSLNFFLKSHQPHVGSADKTTYYW